MTLRFGLPVDFVDRLRHNKNLFVSKKHLWTIQSDLFNKLLSENT